MQQLHIVRTVLSTLALAGCVAPSQDTSPSDAASPAVAGPIQEQVDGRFRALGLSSDHALKPLLSPPNTDGVQHLRYQQTYRGVPVRDGIVTVQLVDDRVTQFRAAKVAAIDLDPVPAIDEDRATAIARDAFGRDAPARTTLMIDTDYEKRIVRSRPEPAPLNADEVTRVPTGHHLTWDVLIGDQTSAETYVIDAQTGAIRRHGASRAEDTATARTEYNGTQTVGISSSGCGKFNLVDLDRGASPTLGIGNIVNTVLFSNTDKVFGDGSPPAADFSNFNLCDPAFAIKNVQTAGADAAFGRTVTWDMYMHVFGLYGWDNHGGEAPIYVHSQENNSHYDVSPFATPSPSATARRTAHRTRRSRSSATSSRTAWTSTSARSAACRSTTSSRRGRVTSSARSRRST